MKLSGRSKHTGLSNISQKSDDVAKYYDDWASDYDATLSDWRYEAPDQVALMLREKLLPASAILDVGCGTGLSGKALLKAGFIAIDGIDVSRQSLEIANMTGIYRTLRAIDLQQLPAPIPDDNYDGLACVGVLTYLKDSTGALSEFSRLVKSGGVVVVTQRSDLFEERDFMTVLDGFLEKQVIADVSVTEPRPYLPDNEEFSDQILVRYISFKVV